MSSDDKRKLTIAELAEVKSAAKSTLYVSMGVTLVWLYAYNIVVNDMSVVLAFFKVLDGINDLVIGMLSVIVIGIGIVSVFTITNLFTQTMTNLYSLRIMEDLIREHLFHGEWKEFLGKMIHFNDQPKPITPFPRYVSSALMVFSYHYIVSWFYLVVFSECLYFAAWSAGVYLELFPETMSIIPMFAVAIPFTARLMAYFRYPYVDDYASFIPGILFVVVLLLAFVAYMDGPFQFLLVDIHERESLPFFAKGSLFWKFLKDGVMIAFYPVFGEVVFFYLLYQDLQKEVSDPEHESELLDGVGDIIDWEKGEENDHGTLDT